MSLTFGTGGSWAERNQQAGYDPTWINPWVSPTQQITSRTSGMSWTRRWHTWQPSTKLTSSSYRSSGGLPPLFRLHCVPRASRPHSWFPLCGLDPPFALGQEIGPETYDFRRSGTLPDSSSPVRGSPSLLQPPLYSVLATHFTSFADPTSFTSFCTSAQDFIFLAFFIFPAPQHSLLVRFYC